MTGRDFKLVLQVLNPYSCSAGIDNNRLGDVFHLDTALVAGYRDLPVYPGNFNRGVFIRNIHITFDVLDMNSPPGINLHISVEVCQSALCVSV